MKQIITW